MKLNNKKRLKFIRWYLVSLAVLALISLFLSHNRVVSEAEAVSEPHLGGLLVQSTLSYAPDMAFIGSNSPLQRSSPIPSSFAPLEAWLSGLEEKENCPPDGVWDVHSLSYGIYCYKEKTFLGFLKTPKYRKALAPNTEDGELMNLIGDPLFQRNLTRMIVLNESADTIENLWWTSIVKRGLGLPPL